MDGVTPGGGRGRSAHAGGEGHGVRGELAQSKVVPHRLQAIFSTIADPVLRELVTRYWSHIPGSVQYLHTSDR